MEFFDTGYIIFAPIVFVLYFILRKPYKIYTIQALAVINVLLLFNSWLVMHQLYSLYSLSKYLNNGNAIDIEIGWQETRMLLTVLVPFLFLKKYLIANKWLSFLMFALLSYSYFIYVVDAITGKSEFFFSFFTTNNFIFKLMHYCCWIIVVYVILRHIKYLPKANHNKPFID